MLRRLSENRHLPWIIWGVAVVAQLLNMMHRVAGSAAVDKFMADFNITAAAAGAMLATYFYVYASMQFPSGILADYLGPRKTITYGCLTASIGSVVFGLAPTLSILYLGRFLVSLGLSVIYVSLLKIQAEWFRSRYFNRMTSLSAVAGSIGTLLGTTPIALLVTIAGWRFSFEAVGGIGLIIGFACWLIIRDKPSDTGFTVPQEVGKQQYESRSTVKPQNTTTVAFRERARATLGNKYIWPPFLIGVGLYGTLLVFQGAWGIPYLMQVYSMARNSAANLMLLTAVGGIFGLLTIPFIADSLQRRKAPALICTLCYLAVWGMLVLWNGGKPPASALYPIYFLMGYFTGYMPAIYATTKEVVPSYASGMAMGLVNMSIFTSAALFQIVVGRVLDANWQGAVSEGSRLYPLAAYQSAFEIVCIGVAACVIGALLLKETHCRDIYDELQTGSRQPNGSRHRHISKTRA